jgi:hypothetical protein
LLTASQVADAARRLRERSRRAFGLVLGLLAIASLTVGGRWLAFSALDVGTVSAAARSAGDDALWLAHPWVDGRRNEADVRSLADRLRTTGISELFVHVGPFGDDGTLDPSLRPRARWFAGEIHRLSPRVRVLAWLGDRVRPGGSMDLQSAVTRSRVVASIRSVGPEGFDGVHLDFEPVGDADPGYLALLDEVRPIEHARGAIVSVSAEQTEPAPGARWAMDAVSGHDSWWSRAYLHQVAIRVDEVAVMSYDTALWSASAYAGFVREETALALGAGTARRRTSHGGAGIPHRQPRPS